MVVPHDVNESQSCILLSKSYALHDACIYYDDFGPTPVSRMEEFDSGQHSNSSRILSGCFRDCLKTLIFVHNIYDRMELLPST